MCKNSRNYDFEISSILTVYVYISDNILSNDEQGSMGRQRCQVPGVQWFVVGWSVVFIVLLAMWPSSWWVCSPKERVCSVNHMEHINSELLLCGDWGGVGPWWVNDSLYLHLWGDVFVRCGGWCSWHMVCSVGWGSCLAPCSLYKRAWRWMVQ